MTTRGAAEALGAAAASDEAPPRPATRPRLAAGPAHPWGGGPWRGTGAAGGAVRRVAQIVGMGPSYRDQIATAKNSPSLFCIDSPFDQARCTFFNCEACSKWRLAVVNPPRGPHAGAKWEMDAGRRIAKLTKKKVCSECLTYSSTEAEDAEWVGWVEGSDHPTKKGLNYTDLSLLRAALAEAGADAVHPTTVPVFDWETGVISHPPTRSALKRIEASLSKAGRPEDIRVPGVCREGSRAPDGESKANLLAHPACHSAQRLDHVDLVHGYEHFPEPCRRCLRLWEWPQCKFKCTGCYNVPAECGMAFWRGPGGRPPPL